jgi:hypothetical protein
MIRPPADSHLFNDTIDDEKLEATLAYKNDRFHVAGEDPLRD